MTAVLAAATTPRDADAADGLMPLQRRRRLFQAGFFALFLLAPALDLLRFDLTETQLYVLGMRWSLGIDALMRGEVGPTEAALTLLVRGIAPAVLVVTGFLAVAWRYGRLYCGWLCPHFSAVELLNDLLHRACGRFSLWDREPVPVAGRAPKSAYGLLFVAAAVLLAALWAVTLLTYLLPPARVWGHLLAGTPTPAEARFIGVATLLFTVEFLFARHLFCRFGCAVGFFQSLAWMANPRALVVGFNRSRSRDCRDCVPPQGSACDHACPMRLHPRQAKRWMFSCVQCGRCLRACDRSMRAGGRAPLLAWTVGADALRETLRARRRLDQGASPVAASDGLRSGRLQEP
jgi:ferredoxin-type protein NapH